MLDILVCFVLDLGLESEIDVQLGFEFGVGSH